MKLFTIEDLPDKVNRERYNIRLPISKDVHFVSRQMPLSDEHVETLSFNCKKKKRLVGFIPLSYQDVRNFTEIGYFNHYVLPLNSSHIGDIYTKLIDIAEKEREYSELLDDCLWEVEKEKHFGDYEEGRDILLMIRNQLPFFNLEYRELDALSQRYVAWRAIEHKAKFMQVQLDKDMNKLENEEFLGELKLMSGLYGFIEFQAHHGVNRSNLLFQRVFDVNKVPLNLDLIHHEMLAGAFIRSMDGVNTLI